MADPESLTLDVEGRPVPVRLRRSVQARRMSLRLDAQTDSLVLVLPRRTPVREGERFVHAHREWVRVRLARLPPRLPFAPGTTVPLLGEDHVIRHLPRARRGVWMEDGAICVSGDPEFLARRVQDFLKEEARREIVPRAQAKAERLDVAIRRVTLRDTRSRWGSCNSAGDLAFCWRLIFAPSWVLDYVVAHEVAHLKELNHSARFWRIVANLSPDAAPAKAWLKAHGTGLHRYG
jgi:predicted metal-dependent hydrolase